MQEQMQAQDENINDRKLDYTMVLTIGRKSGTFVSEKLVIKSFLNILIIKISPAALRLQSTLIGSSREKMISGMFFMLFNVVTSKRTAFL